jgi:hypothetical protein
LAKIVSRNTGKSLAAIKRDHPITAALAPATSGEPNVARATRPLDRIACVRAPREVIEDAVDLVIAEARRSGRGDERGGLDDHVHAATPLA